jgi:hypothetical protein
MLYATYTLRRHAVACFLTRGDLWQSWEAGAKVTVKHVTVMFETVIIVTVIYVTVAL